MKGKLFIPIFIIVVFVVGAVLYVYNPSPNEYGNGPEEPEQVFCTQDAKLCPDGSYVGRVPPSCGFAACPSEAPCEDETCQIPEGAIMEDGTILPE